MSRCFSKELGTPNKVKDIGAHVCLLSLDLFANQTVGREEVFHRVWKKLSTGRVCPSE
jgi:hypothetical protein